MCKPPTRHIIYIYTYKKRSTKKTKSKETRRKKKEVFFFFFSEKEGGEKNQTKVETELKNSGNVDNRFLQDKWKDNAIKTGKKMVKKDN